MRDTAYILVGLGAAILVLLAFLFRAVGEKFAKWIRRQSGG
jgi:hypothetical protein